MKLEDALTVVLASLDGCAPPSEASFIWLNAAVEIGIRAIYKAGLVVVDPKDKEDDLV